VEELLLGMVEWEGFVEVEQIGLRMMFVSEELKMTRRKQAKVKEPCGGG
jgi:hypothetical protein